MAKKDAENSQPNHPPQKKEEPHINIQVEVDEATAQGIYANLAMTNFNMDEFALDFLYLQPLLPKSRLRSRIILSPRNAKRLAQMLAHNIRIYEEQFGHISDQPSQPGIQLSIN